MLWLPHRIYGPPIVAFFDNTTETRKLCAGQWDVVRFDYKINRPGIISAVEVIYDAETDWLVSDRSVSWGPIPFDEATEISDFPLGWTVPRLQPGKYYSIMGIYYENIESNPTFLRLDFEVVQCRDGEPVESEGD